MALKAQRLDYNGDPITTVAEEIYFVIKRRWVDEEPAVKIGLDEMTFDAEGYYHFVIKPEDTENLPYGTYVWDFTAVEDNDNYRAKPAHGYFLIGNSAGWIINEDEEV